MVRKLATKWLNAVYKMFNFFKKKNYQPKVKLDARYVKETYKVNQTQQKRLWYISGELVKFKLFPKAECLHCLRVSLVHCNFSSMFMTVSSYTCFIISGYVWLSFTPCWCLHDTSQQTKLDTWKILQLSLVVLSFSIL